VTRRSNAFPCGYCFKTIEAVLRRSYRCGRRKDVLLQENGYFVLRFLGEDVGKHLDTVLDALLRSLSHRRKK
jgi:very-short-patch-repair endonuclease